VAAEKHERSTVCLVEEVADPRRVSWSKGEVRMLLLKRAGMMAVGKLSCTRKPRRERRAEGNKTARERGKVQISESF